MPTRRWRHFPSDSPRREVLASSRLTGARHLPWARFTSTPRLLVSSRVASTDAAEGLPDARTATWSYWSAAQGQCARSAPIRRRSMGDIRRHLVFRVYVRSGDRRFVPPHSTREPRCRRVPLCRKLDPVLPVIRSIGSRQRSHAHPQFAAHSPHVIQHVDRGLREVPSRVGLSPFAARTSPVFRPAARMETPAAPVVPGDLDTLRARAVAAGDARSAFLLGESVMVPHRT